MTFCIIPTVSTRESCSFHVKSTGVRPASMSTRRRWLPNRQIPLPLAQACQMPLKSSCAQEGPSSEGPSSEAPSSEGLSSGGPSSEAQLGQAWWEHPPLSLRERCPSGLPVRPPPGPSASGWCRTLPAGCKQVLSLVSDATPHNGAPVPHDGGLLRQCSALIQMLMTGARCVRLMLPITTATAGTLKSPHARLQGAYWGLTTIV